MFVGVSATEQRVSVTENVDAVTRSKRNCEDMQKKIFGRRVMGDAAHITKYRVIKKSLCT
jgi:hypothetical protein